MQPTFLYGSENWTMRYKLRASHNELLWQTAGYTILKRKGNNISKELPNGFLGRKNVYI